MSTNDKAKALSEVAQRVFANPGAASDQDIAAAAGELNAAINAAEIELQTARARRERESLDLFAAGDEAGVLALHKAEHEAEQRLKMLQHAVTSANKRLVRGEQEKEHARLVKIFDKIRGHIDERERAVRDLFMHAKATAEAYIKAGLLSDEIWGLLPVSVGVDRGQIEMMTVETLQEGLNRILGFYTGNLFKTYTEDGKPTSAHERNPDILSACQRGHGVILSVAPRLGGVLPRIVVTGEEFKRRQRATGVPPSVDSKLTDDGWVVGQAVAGVRTSVTAAEFEELKRAADA